MWSAPMSAVGPVGRLGRWTATHFRAVVLTWAAIAVAMALFAPRVEHALSGAGWESTGSESVAARDLVNKQFGGMSSSALMVVISSDSINAQDPQFAAVVAEAERELRRDPRVSRVVGPQPGVSISPDGHTAVVRAGAAASSNEMVRAADDLKGPLSDLSTGGVNVALTGSSGMWSDFNAANKDAMLKSELLSWPVTLAILLVAFGSLVAAGLPLLLTIIGLLSAAGMLFLGAQLTDISIWAMNFALMFALALGIDYALFVVHRFRGAYFGSRLTATEAVATTMDTAGKAVLFSGMTVLISLSAVMLVPSPAFRSMSLGIMLAVIFVMAATLTLLPAVLAKLGPRVDKLSLPWVHSGEHRSARFAAWAERLWRRPLLYGLPALAVLAVLAVPLLRLDTGMPSIKVVPEGDSSRVGYTQVQQAFGPGAPGAIDLVGPRAAVAATTAAASADSGIAAVTPVQLGADRRTALVQVIPATDPSSSATGATIDRLRAQASPAVLVGGAVAENHDLEATLKAKTPLVIGVVLALGFVLLLVALQAPLVALLGVITNLLATGAAFGVGGLVFQGRAPEWFLGFRATGLPRCLGARVLLRDGVCDRDGLQRLPAQLSPRALGALPGSPRGHGRRSCALRPGDLCRGSRHGRRLLHFRPLRAAAAEGDGGDPGRRGAPRCPLDQVAPASGPAAPRRPLGVVASRLAWSRIAAGELQPRLTRTGVRRAGRG
jgi:RND superfamily putative drug exporter